MKALDYVKALGVAGPDPSTGAFIDSYGVDDERIAFVTAD